MHVLLVLAAFAVLFFPSHILWSITLIASVVWALCVWVLQRSFGNQNYPALSMMIFYLILCVSGMWAADKVLYLHAIRMKLVLLGMPFCFLVWQKWSVWQLESFTKGLLWIVGFSAIYVLWNYEMHQADILLGMLKGQSIPVPFKDHIRYAILLCFSLILNLYQTDRYRKRNDPKRFYRWLAVSIGLFFYIQFLAVKTGMLLSILVMLCFIIHKVVEKKIYFKGMIALLTVFGTLFVVIRNVPTVQNKLSYFFWDLSQYKENRYQQYSDGERIVSIVKGLEIVRGHYILGVGEGNLARHMDLPDGKLPHNQLIVVWAQNGIFGLASFMAVFIVSFWVSIKRQNWLAFTYTLAMFIANMLEPMLETQLGLTLFVLPLLILHALDSNTENIAR